MDFAVQLDGGDLGFWVLVVDPVGDRLLVINPDDKSLRWVDITQCKLMKAKDPEVPLPVLVVQSQQNGLVVRDSSPGRGRY